MRFQNAGLPIEYSLMQAESPSLYFMLPISMLASESSPLVQYIVYCGREVLGVGCWVHRRGMFRYQRVLKCAELSLQDIVAGVESTVVLLFGLYYTRLFLRRDGMPLSP